MSSKINQAELALLQYLHKHSGGCRERIWLDPRPISRTLRMSSDQFAENSASLVARGLAGLRDYLPDAHDVPSMRCSAIWITPKGEDYLRRTQLVRS